MKKYLLAIFLVAGMSTANSAEACCSISKMAQLEGAVATTVLGLVLAAYAHHESYLDHEFARTCQRSVDMCGLDEEFKDAPLCKDMAKVRGHHGGSSNSNMVLSAIVGGPILMTAALNFVVLGVRVVWDGCRIQVKAKRD